MSIEKIIEDIIKVEGGYTNHPSDRGGPTRYGITQAVARENGYKGDMTVLPIDLARKIYRNDYYVKPGFDRIGAISMVIAEELMDTGVNMGVNRAGVFLQTSLNALNRNQLEYPDLKVDGDCGNKTVHAFQLYMNKRKNQNGEKVLLTALNCLQGSKYIDICIANPTQEDFLYGWLANRVIIPS